MKIAIVAVGELARYFTDEIPLHGHTVVCISRNPNPVLTSLGIEQRTTDYSPDSLAALLADCDAAVCTLRRGIPAFAAIHAAVLGACAASPTCKRFIPSAWAGNLQDWPDEPLDWAEELGEVLAMLRAQDDVSWSAMCPGWFAEYVLPDARQRHMGDIGDMWPQDYKNKVFTLYGDGGQLVNITSARDAARATIRLLAENDRRSWGEFTYVSGEQLSWRQLGEFVRSRDPAYRLQRKSLAASVKQYVGARSAEDKAAAVFELWAHSEALHFPLERVQKHREMFFTGMKFRALEDVVKDADAAPGRVV